MTGRAPSALRGLWGALLAALVATTILLTGVAPAGAGVAADPSTTLAPTTSPAEGGSSLPSVSTDGTTSTPTGPVDDPAQDRLRYIIWGLVGLAVVVAVATVMLWRATSPKRAVTVSVIPVEGDEQRPPIPTGTRVAPVAPDPLMAPTRPLPPE